MKIICQRKELSDGINIALKSVPSKTTMPILECLLLQVKDDRIKIISNNMELGIETAVFGTILEEGSILVDAKMFGDIIRRLPDDEVVIQVCDNLAILIKSGKSRFTLNGLHADEFPLLPPINKLNSISLSQFSLKEMIRQTVFSVSDNEKNKLMTGELFEVNGNEFRIVALDGHRISIRCLKLRESYDSFKCIVPGKTLVEIGKILSGNLEDEVQVFFAEKHVLFEFGNTIVLSRLIDGEYYAVNKMISNHYETKIIANRLDLLNCIERANIMLQDNMDRKPLLIQVKEDKMNISMDVMKGDYKDELDIEKEGKDILVAFNPRYFIESLRVVEDEEVHIYMINQKSPCIMKDADMNYVYLILPINSGQD